MYLVLFVVTLAMNVTLALTDHKLITLGFIALIWTLDIIVFTTIWCSKASFIERDPEVSLISLMETFEAESLCPFCRVIRLPQSRHCNICNQCVERYDHHCPWVNNCIGRTNHANFYIHLLLVLAYCITSLINASVSLFKTSEELVIKVPTSLITTSIVTLLAFGLFFGMLISVLVVNQTQNLMQGMTSTERTRRARTLTGGSEFNQSETANQDSSMQRTSKLEDDSGSAMNLKSFRSERPESIFQQVEMHNMSNDTIITTAEQSCFRNCSRMLCDRQKAPEQIDIYERYRAPLTHKKTGRQTPRFQSLNGGSRPEQRFE